MDWKLGQMRPRCGDHYSIMRIFNRTDKPQESPDGFWGSEWWDAMLELDKCTCGHPTKQTMDSP